MCVCACLRYAGVQGCRYGWMDDRHMHTHTYIYTCVQYSSCRSSERDVCCARGSYVSSSCGGTPRSLPAPRRESWTLTGQAWTKTCAKSPIVRGNQCLLTLRAHPALPAVSFLMSTMTRERCRAGKADGCVNLCAGEFSLCESQSGDECDAVNAETGCTTSRSRVFSIVRVCKHLPKCQHACARAFVFARVRVMPPCNRGSTLTAYHSYRYTG